MSTEIALTERGVELKTLTHVKEYVALVKAAGLLPRNMTVEQATIAILHGREIGVSPLQAVQGIGIINGKPGAYGDLFMGLIQEVIEDMEEFFEGTPYQDNYTAVCRIKRKGQSWHEKRFSVGMAKQAKLWGKAGPWTEYPDRQLQMRARGFAGRDRCADRLKGLISSDEAFDYPTNGKPEAQRAEARVKTSKPLEPKRKVGEKVGEKVGTAENSPPPADEPPAETLEAELLKPQEPLGREETDPSKPKHILDYPAQSEAFIDYETAFDGAASVDSLDHYAGMLREALKQKPDLLLAGERDKLLKFYAARKKELLKAKK